MLLEDLGQVRTTIDAEQRRLHEVTAEGRAFLEAHRVSLEEMQSRIPGRRGPEADARIDAVRAAMDHHKQALRTTLGGGLVDAERIARARG